MAIVTHKCPHCLTEHIALNIAAHHPIEDGWVQAVHLDCPKCRKPSAAIVCSEDQRIQTNHWGAGDIATFNWVVREFWPVVPGPLIPENLPADVERIYLAAERNYPTEGNEEPAGAMYRKALDVGLKKIDPDNKGVLAARIKKLADDGRLTADIQEWSGHIRVLGNEAAHDEEPPTRDELKDLRSFTEMVMRYLFSLPAMVTARKPPSKPEGESRPSQAE
jgi:hypothetical protein